MASVLLVSKPVEPPWNDSSKNLVRDLAQAMRAHRPTVLIRKHGSPLLGAKSAEAYARAAGGFAPPLADRARVLVHLTTDRSDLWHFFFAPNRATSRAGRLLSRVRRVPTVHTVCSAPRRDARLDEVLFAHANVVLSEHTERRLVAGGARRVVRIPPSVPALPPLSDAERAEARARFGLQAEQVVVYPGDLEIGGGAARMVDAVAARPGWQLALACRTKTPAAVGIAAELERHAARVAPGRVVWIGETADILSLLGAADVVALPSDDLYAKMDYPLALLEAMVMGVPVVVAEETAAAELGRGGAVVVAPRVETLVRALGTLEDAEVRRELGAAGRSHALAEHGAEAMARRYETLYDELLEERRR